LLQIRHANDINSEIESVKNQPIQNGKANTMQNNWKLIVPNSTWSACHITKNRR